MGRPKWQKPELQKNPAKNDTEPHSSLFLSQKLRRCDGVLSDWLIRQLSRAWRGGTGHAPFIHHSK
jgi:hypothetical protein